MTTLVDTAGDVAPACTDANNDPLAYSIVDQPVHGSASVVGSTLHYVPNPGYTGGDLFTYQANDGALDSNTATVTVTVLAEITNYGLELNGSSQYVTFGAAPELGASTFTLETWFKWTGGGATTNTGSGGVVAIPLVTKGRGEADGSNLDMNYFLGIDPSTDALVADFEANPGGQNYPVSGSLPITTNAWHHAAVTYGGGTWNLYLDGVLDTSLPVTGSPVPQANSIQHAGLGTAMNSSGTREGYFAGVIDEARIWNVARTQAQIVATKDVEITSPTTGLLGRWGLNEGSGTTASGLSGIAGAHDGTYTGVTLGAPGALAGDSDTAATFDGSGDYVTVPDAAALDLGDGPFSIEVWFKRAAAAPFERLVSKAAGGVKGYDVSFGGTNVLALKDSLDGTFIATTETVLDDTCTWHHAVFTKNGAVSHAYLDGVPDETLYADQTLVDTAGALYLGARDGTQQFFNGSMDEVALYDAVLTPSQVAAHVAAASSAGYAATVLGDNPVAYWRLGESSGTTATDSAGTAVNGSIVGIPDWVPGFMPGTGNQPPGAPTNPSPSNGATDVVLPPTLTVDVADDPDGDDQTVTFYGRPKPDLADDPFTFVVLPDTQYYSQSAPSLFTAQTSWIVANKDALNIKFVSHLGDVVDQGDANATAWNNANSSMSLLDGQVPYSLTVGNHDAPPNTHRSWPPSRPAATPARTGTAATWATRPTPSTISAPTAATSTATSCLASAVGTSWS